MKYGSERRVVYGLFYILLSLFSRSTFNVGMSEMKLKIVSPGRTSRAEKF